MDYLTLEVEIDHGKISPKGSLPLPEKAIGLLTIFSPALTAAEQQLVGQIPKSDLVADVANLRRATFLQTLESLQKHLKLDSAGAQKWMDDVQAARR
jgi:hypothetical protein